MGQEGDAVKDHLVVAYVPDSYSEFQLVWYNAEEGEHGASIGEYDGDVSDCTDDDDRLFRLAERVVQRLADEWGADAVYRSSSRIAWQFSSKSKATEALRQIKAEWKALQAATPWPEWAVEAVRNGWKPPKGWTP